MKKIIVIVLLAFIFGACTDQFEEANKNPYEISGVSLQQDFNHVGSYYSSMLTSLFGSQTEENLVDESFVNHMATPTSFNGGVNNTTYYIWRNTYWNRVYNGIMAPSQNVIRIAEADHYDVFVAWAKLIRVLGMSKVTAHYGPVIYSKYGSGEPVINYDSEQELYNIFFTQLDEILAIFNANKDYPGMKKFDASYGGDVKKWIKVVNSMRLRLAIRISKVAPATAKTQAEKAISEPGGLITTNGDNFNVSLYGAKLTLAVICFEWNDTRMSAAMESFLVGLKDNRISKYFQPAADASLFPDHPNYPYKGIRNGATLGAKDTRLSFSMINESFKTVTSRRVFTAQEVHFDLAEAALRGWAGAGDAKTNYENGVKASFADWGASGVDDYLADGTSKPLDYKDPKSSPVNDFVTRSSITVKWEDGDSNELKLEKIITQKWIANFTTSLEAWCDHRRTGYPKLPYNYQNDSSKDWGIIAPDDFIKRMPFITPERTGNPIGVAGATEKLGGPDLISTRLWWDTGGPNF